MESDLIDILDFFSGASLRKEPLISKIYLFVLVSNRLFEGSLILQEES